MDDYDVRHLRLLIEGLDPDGALYREMNPEWYWSWEEELLAVVAEQVNRMDRHLVALFTKKGTALPRVLNIPRPQLEAKKFKGTTKAEFFQMVKDDLREA